MLPSCWGPQWEAGGRRGAPALTPAEPHLSGRPASLPHWGPAVHAGRAAWDAHLQRVTAGFLFQLAACAALFPKDAALPSSHPSVTC